VPPATRERHAPAGPGRNSRQYRNRVWGAVFHFLTRNQVPEGQGHPAVTGGSMYLAWTFFVPGVYLRCTRGCFSAGRGHARPSHGGGLLTVFTLHAARAWGAGGVCVLRVDAVPALAGETALAALVRGGQAGAGAVCSRGSAARRACRGAGDGSTGTAKTWQPTGTGSPATGRSARGQHPLGRTVRCRRGRPSAGFPGREPGTVRRAGRPFRRVREPAAIPHRQLIRIPIRIPADSGMPSRR
jgi:hypothetical protein